MNGIQAVSMIFVSDASPIKIVNWIDIDIANMTS